MPMPMLAGRWRARGRTARRARGRGGSGRGTGGMSGRRGAAGRCSFRGCGAGGAGGVGVGGDRREADRRQHGLALAGCRQTAFHASCTAVTGMKEAPGMDDKLAEQIALHRWAVIAEAAGANLTAAERGALVRQITARPHPHPDGSPCTYSRGTVDRWLRAWRAGGLDALRPSPRSDTRAGRAHPELFAEACPLRLELPARSAAQIASVFFHPHGGTRPERTVRRQLRPAALHPEALAAEPKAYRRYEAG